MRLSLFADDMIVYMENPIDSIKKLLDQISEFCKKAGYKINTRNQRHCFTQIMKYQKEKSGKKIPFAMETRKIKYL